MVLFDTSIPQSTATKYDHFYYRQTYFAATIKIIKRLSYKPFTIILIKSKDI